MFFNVKVILLFPLKCYLLMTVEKIIEESTSLALLLTTKETGTGEISGDHVLCQFRREHSKSQNGGCCSLGSDPKRAKEEGLPTHLRCQQSGLSCQRSQSKLHSLQLHSELSPPPSFQRRNGQKSGSRDAALGLTTFHSPHYVQHPLGRLVPHPK